MLTLTDNARTAVETLTARSGLPAESGGLRIEEQDSGAFDLALVAGPTPGDDVVEAGAARVYVDERTAATLAASQLDVEATGTGTAFTLNAQ
ncbi:iron-sulfur cluster assembly accessory protein [Cellulomonas palmilytica]|uniref:adhesin n=1 Tax=Cellulomonas palmilytica TaxID=2608402 RepID=UPI001F321DE6|nr:adhesin [Cellulomonas palmilytica]UJP39988.1 adhesin [Cellulomonas palmilytica]